MANLAEMARRMLAIERARQRSKCATREEFAALGTELARQFDALGFAVNDERALATLLDICSLGDIQNELTVEETERFAIDLSLPADIAERLVNNATKREAN